MYLRRKIIEYPYHGQFFRDTEGDMCLPLDEREQTDELVYETVCDIQEVSKANNPVLIATFSVFFPIDPGKDIAVRRGMRFHGVMNGIDVNGLITNVVVSRLGGAVAYVKDYDADEGV